MFDPDENARDDAEASRRLPGPDYYRVLSWIQETLRPAVYLEIGVLYGESLRLALPPTRAIGVDPEPLADHVWQSPTVIYRMTSREYFARPDVPRIGLAFLDGSHRFADTLEDFLAVERHCEEESVILVHDTIPLDARTSAPVRSTDFYTGDVWRMLPWLAAERPELDVVTVPTAPSGLTMVRRAAGTPDSGLLENSHLAVQRWLLRHQTAVQSMRSSGSPMPASSRNSSTARRHGSMQ